MRCALSPGPVRRAGREIIANLSKAAGLATMIAAMRPDIDNIDEYVRNTTARAFSVVASALGVPALLPFLKAVCLSKKSWQARPHPSLCRMVSDTPFSWVARPLWSDCGLRLSPRAQAPGALARRKPVLNCC